MSNQASLDDISGSGSTQKEKETEETSKDNERRFDPIRIERDEFGDLPEEWEYKPIDKLKEYLESGCSKSQNKKGNGFPVSRIETIADGTVNYKKVGYVPEDKIDAEKYRHKKGELLFSNINSREEIGKTAIFKDEKTLYHGMNILRIKLSEEMNDYFGYYLFDSEMGYRVFFRNSQAAVGQSSINQAQLKSINLPVPEDLDEQRRIASVLYNVDQAIQKTEEIIEQTNRVKKGLMQDLFTEGYYNHEEFEEHPLLGERPASWSVETVGDLTKKVQYGLSEALQEEGEYPIFRMNNYENGYMRDYPMKYIDLSEDEFQKYKVEKGDILFNRTNSHELVGKTGIFELEEDYVFASYLVRLRTNEKVDPYYLNFFMNSEEGQNRLKTFATKGVSQSNINASSVQKLKVPVPNKKEEQKKIVEAIKNLDNKIEWNKNYLEDLNSLKKGLMQDLLTGKVRTSEDVKVLDEVVEVEG